MASMSQTISVSCPMLQRLAMIPQFMSRGKLLDVRFCWHLEAGGFLLPFRADGVIFFYPWNALLRKKNALSAQKCG